MYANVFPLFAQLGVLTMLGTVATVVTTALLAEGLRRLTAAHGRGEPRISVCQARP